MTITYCCCFLLRYLAVMIDLSTYRIRIGRFISSIKSRYNKHQNVKISRPVSREHGTSIKTLYVVWISSVTLCVVLQCHLEQSVGSQSRTSESYSKVQYSTSCLYKQRFNEVKGNALVNLILYKFIMIEIYLAQIMCFIGTLYSNNQTGRYISYNVEPVEVCLTVDSHGTCSFLLGNTGQHVYNGNPPKEM